MPFVTFSLTFSGDSKKCFGNADIDNAAYPAAPAINTTESAGAADLLCLLPDIGKANSLIQDILNPSR